MDAYFCAWIFLTLTTGLVTLSKTNLTCEPPGGCRIKKFFTLNNVDAGEHVSHGHRKGLRCEIDDAQFRFDFKSWLLKNQSKACRQAKFNPLVELKMVTTKNILLEKSFDLQGVIDFLLFQFNSEFSMKLSFLKRISVDLGIQIRIGPAEYFV